jgi:hypothetical protein
MRCVVRLLIAWLATAAISTAAAERDSLPTFAVGQSLESALTSLNASGFRIAFSTALVRGDMRITSLPDAPELDSLLAQLLAPWGLIAERAEDGSYRVVRARRRHPAAAAGADAEAVMLSAVDVTASRFGLMQADSTATLFLDRAQLQAYPHLTDDALRALRVLPGVSGGDFTARLHVRGGRRDEVALRVDGVEINDPFHLRELDGPIGLLDTNLVERIELTTGGLTADFGGRMSGLVDITTRVPQADDPERHAVGISFINTFARTGGRFAEDRGDYLISARRGYLDLVLEQVADDDEEFAPRYHDLLARAGFRIGERTKLTAGALAGMDDMTFVTDDDEDISAGTAESVHFWLTLDHEFAGGMNLRTIAAFGDVRQDRIAVKDEPDQLFADLDTTRKLRFATLRQDWSWQPAGRQLFRFGGWAAQYRADYDYSRVSFILDPVITGGTPIDTSSAVALDARTTELGTYAAWRSELRSGLFGEIGLRYDLYGGDVHATRISPRLNLVYDPGGSTQYRIALSRVHQPQRADELQVEDGVTRFSLPERADQLSFGVTRRLGDSTTLRIDGYMKRYDDQRPRFENLLRSLELISEAEPDRVRVEVSEARSNGIELSLQAKPTERTRAWTSYVYSKTEDRDADGWHPRLWDQRHALGAGFAWFGDRWRVSVAGNWHTGWPTTRVTVEESVDEGGQPVIHGLLGRRNGARLGSFTRFDLRASRSRRYDSGTLTWYVEIYNLLNARNPCCVEDFNIRRDSGGTLIAVPNHDYWLPILPSFGVQFEF